MRFLEYCNKHWILVTVYPPHLTHRLQPLDVSLFSLLAIYYSQELNQFLHKSEGFCSLTKRDFFWLFWAAFGKAFTTSNIESGWKRTGLYPFESSVILDKFPTNKDNRPSLSELKHLLCTPDDWWKVCRLLNSSLADPNSQRSKQIVSMVLGLMGENKIL